MSIHIHEGNITFLELRPHAAQGRSIKSQKSPGLSKQHTSLQCLLYKLTKSTHARLSLDYYHAEGLT